MAYPRVYDFPIVDYLDSDGVLHCGKDSAAVQVKSESDLSGLDGYSPGAIAYTAGFGKMWQLAEDGSWEPMNQ